jgi:hypothetical protein
MLPRTIDDRAPSTRSIPEGVIENFDGHTVPYAVLPLGQPDRPQPQLSLRLGAGLEAGGRGRLPLSEVSRARSSSSPRHPEIFLWLNLHTFGGVFIRPLGDKPDTKMNQEDLALYRQLGAWAEELTGYPMVSGCRGVPLRARYAAPRRPDRLRVHPARRGRLVGRAVGPVQAVWHRAQESASSTTYTPVTRDGNDGKIVHMGPRPQRGTTLDPAVASRRQHRSSAKWRAAAIDPRVWHVKSAARG